MNLCVQCRERPRRFNRQKSYSLRCSSCEWENKKANPKRHSHAKDRNRVSSAKYRKTPKRAAALKKYAKSNANLLRQYGITPDEWRQVWEFQGRACAICKALLRDRFDEQSEGGRANTDHQHRDVPKYGLRYSVRGLLCWVCNSKVLYKGRDYPHIMRAAVEYLENPPARQALGTKPNDASN